MSPGSQHGYTEKAFLAFQTGGTATSIMEVQEKHVSPALSAGKLMDFFRGH